jgi:protein ImuB
VFAVLHIADFALHAVLRTESVAPGLPAALFSSGGKKSVVLAANTVARAAGVEIGMTAPQAVARCPSLIIRPPRESAEADARAALLSVGLTLSPVVEDTLPGVCTADVSGFDPAKLFAAVQTAGGELASLALPATAGIAATPLLALYAARAAPRASAFRSVLTDPPLPAALAEPAGNAYLAGARLNTPVLQVTDAATFLAPLPLSAADPSPALAAILQGWGLRTLGDLTTLPRDEIVLRFGADGLALWSRAAGGAPRPLHPVAPPREFFATMDFEEPIATLEPLLFVLRRFLDRLSLELRAHHRVAAELEFALRLEDETSHTRRFRLPEPTGNAEILFRALHSHLESLSTDASIIAVQLRLTPTRPLVRQQDLFETGLRDPHGFAETLARVSALVGSERIGAPRREDTHRPDAVRFVAPPTVIPPPAEPPLHAALGPPLRRFRPPLPVRVGVGDDGSAYVWSDGLRGEISFRSQAYPSNGDWWQADQAWSRIEWDIALGEGGLYRLIRVGDEWFIEGEYD